jgi:hypothetical protein
LIIQTVSKSLAPVLNYENFWKDPDGNSCYLWNGELSSDARTFEQSPDSLWKFSSDGAGGGAWSQIPINYTMLSSLSQRLLRPGGTGSGVAIGSTGYYVGGRVWEQSDVDASPTGYFQNTVTSFNSSSGAWNNELPTRIGSSGTIEGARAVTIPAIGLDERGLMVIIGGRDPGTNVSAPSANYFGLDNVTIYDPYIDVWFAQHATGEVIPAIREMFCAVATAGDNGTYEM